MAKLETLFPTSFSNSMMEDVWSCEMKFFRRYCQRLVGGPANPDLVAGGTFASACELIRKSYYNEGLEAEEAIERGYNFIIESPDTGHDFKSNERLAYAVERYFKKYPLESSLIPLKLADGTHSIEYSFDFDLGIPHPEIPDRNISFKGKLDMLAGEYYRDKLLRAYVVDEKSTGSVRRLKGTKVVDIVAEEDNYKLSQQFINYNWAARQLGIKTEGTKVRKVPVMATFEPAFELTIPVTEFMIQQWSSTMMNKIEELKDKYLFYKENMDSKDFYPHTAFYPVYSSNCTSYMRLCQYNIGCRDKDGEQVLASSLAQRVWDSEKKEEIDLSVYKERLGVI